MPSLPSSSLEDDATFLPNTDKCLCTVSSSPTRRLVVAFDGTENRFGPKSSHVVEFYSRIIKSSDQLSYYNSGIGTYVKPSRTERVRTVMKNKWASITAWNFKSNLLAGYRWLSDNYKEGDQIFLLGFSRGAYQARVLAAMIDKVGLLRTGNSEQIPFAFEIYKDPKSSEPVEVEITNDETEAEEMRNVRHQSTRVVFTPAEEFKKAFCYQVNGHQVNVHFVGVWDTVSSVGFFRNKTYPGAESVRNVCFFRHALALDERRVRFQPEYVVAPKEYFEPGEFTRPRCKEVWFRGSHSDVGGGNIRNPTLDIGGVPSRWMAYEAMLAGLQMNPFKRDWSLNELRGRRPMNSMTWCYRIFEYFPIAWLDTSKSPICPEEDTMQASLRKYKRSLHREAARVIHSHQKLHISVGMRPYNKDRDERTLADLSNLSKSEWPTICGLLIKTANLTFPSDLSTVHSVPEEPSATAAEVRNTVTEASKAISRFLSIDNPTKLPSSANNLLKPYFELDFLDFHYIPTLIAHIQKKSNVIEFLERLNLIGHTSEGKQKLRECPELYDMILSLNSGDITIENELGIRLSYKLFLLSDPFNKYESSPEIIAKISSSDNYFQWLRTLRNFVFKGSTEDFLAARAMILLLQGAKGDKRFSELGSFLTLKLPLLENGRLEALKVGNTPQTLDVDVLLLLSEYLPVDLPDTEATRKIFEFVLDRFQLISESVDISRMVRVLRENDLLGNPFFRDLLFQRQTLLRKMLDLLKSNYREYKEAANYVIRSLIQDNDSMVKQAVYEKATRQKVIECLYGAGSEFAQSVLSNIVEESPATLTQGASRIKPSKTNDDIMLAVFGTIYVNNISEKHFLKVWVVLAQPSGEGEELMDSNLLYKTLISLIQDKGSERRDSSSSKPLRTSPSDGYICFAALCLVVLCVLNEDVATKLFESPDTVDIRQRFIDLGGERVWSALADFHKRRLPASTTMIGSEGWCPEGLTSLLNAIRDVDSEGSQSDDSGFSIPAWLFASPGSNPPPNKWDLESKTWACRIITKLTKTRISEPNETEDS